MLSKYLISRYFFGKAKVMPDYLLRKRFPHKWNHLSIKLHP